MSACPHKPPQRERKDGSAVQPAPVKKRKVLPSEFKPRLTKLKGPLTRALAYEDGTQDQV